MKTRECFCRKRGSASGSWRRSWRQRHARKRRPSAQSCSTSRDCAWNRRRLHVSRLSARSKKPRRCGDRKKRRRPRKSEARNYAKQRLRESSTRRKRKSAERSWKGRTEHAWRKSRVLSRPSR